MDNPIGPESFAALQSVQPSSGPASEAAPTFRDRSTGLQVFGVILIVLGAMAALGIPLMLLGAVVSRKATGAAMPLGTYALNCLTYGALALGLVTLGVGSIRRRRWARALTLITAWISLAMGVLVTILMTAVMPSAFAVGFRQAAARNPNVVPLPAGVMAVILTIVIVMFAVFFIVLPLVFVLFYRRSDVEETCRLHDPVERWTDRCPLPVLAASLIFGFAGPYYLFMVVTTPLIPFFGKWLTGLPGIAGCLIFAGLDVYLAVSFFRIQLVGWWIAITTLAVRGLSAAITYRRGDLFGAYSRLGWKPSQVQAMSANPMIRGHVILWWGLGYIVIFLGYIVYLHRYFSAPVDRVNPQIVPVADAMPPL